MELYTTKLTPKDLRLFKLNMSFFSFLFEYGLSGVIAGLIVAYSLACFIAKQWLSIRDINWYKFFLYVTITFLFAVCFEIFSNHTYSTLFGKPLWEYKVMATHGGSTTLLGMFFWPLYGVYLYFLHKAFEIRNWHNHSHWKKGILSGIDGPIIEIILNTFFLFVHQTFFFYYYPKDLFHFTTFQIVPVYALGGIILTYILHYAERIKQNKTYPIFLYILGIFVLL